MSEVVLIRPGSTDYDEQNRIQGSLDLPLSQRGVLQVEDLVEDLREIDLETIYTGPAEPARSTAEALGRALDVRVKEKEELRNLDYGLWQGLKIEDVKRKYPRVYKQWQESPGKVCPPQGEDMAEALNRVKKLLEKQLKKRDVFAVVASEPLATFISCLLGRRPPELPRCLCNTGQPLSVERIATNGRLSDPPAEDHETEFQTGSAAEPAAARPGGGTS